MKDNRVKGIILRKTNYSESDVIFDILSDTGDIIGFFARGAKKMKSKFLGVIQLGLVVNVSFNTGKNLNYPSEISIDKDNVFTFYSKTTQGMNFYIDLLTVTKAVAKDFKSEELFELVTSSYREAQRGGDLLEIYIHFLDEVLQLIGADASLRCSFTGNVIQEKEFYYLPQSNKAFSQNNKPNTVDAELISYDPVFQKNYLQKLVYEHIHHKLVLKF